MNTDGRKRGVGAILLLMTVVALCAGLFIGTDQASADEYVEHNRVGLFGGTHRKVKTRGPYATESAAAFGAFGGGSTPSGVILSAPSYGSVRVYRQPVYGSVRVYAAAPHYSYGRVYGSYRQSYGAVRTYGRYRGSGGCPNGACP